MAQNPINSEHWIEEQGKHRLITEQGELLAKRVVTAGNAYTPKQFSPRVDVGVSYNWTDWIAAAMDDMPHVYQKDGVGYSLGYCGSGVSFFEVD
ncbi:protein of unknown function, might belong to Oxidoreductase [Shewanella benthica]|uniref:Uncharacterized protein n=1 Tax=Shewanella benthica TaxID=43661 RepID=A0A330M6Q1_9GAMM|nr:protein of unknown function, might belong to Oxidoreductase [Shewanella benthica]